MTFKKDYFIVFVILFLIECCIAYFLKTGFIRHTFGDFLIVIMLYCFVRSFFEIRRSIAALIVLVFAFVIEFLQLTSLLSYLNLEDNTTAKLILGSTFHVSDLIAYSLGIITVLLIEKFRKT